MSAVARSHTEPTSSGLDTLSSVCYTIPWRPKKKLKKAVSGSSSAPQELPHRPPFPVLAEFEADGDPARVRYASYQIAVHRTEALFDRCMDDVYSSLFDDLRTFFKAQPTPSHPEASTLGQVGITQEDLFLPGFESADASRPSSSITGDSTKSIQTALLISTSAPYLSSFSNRLVSQISNASVGGPPSIVVTLSASECSNLYTALRLLVARFIAQGSALDSTGHVDLTDVEAAAFAGKVEPDLHVLGSWWHNKFVHSERQPRLVLNLPMIESVEPTVLSDLLSALQTFVVEPSTSTSSSHGAAQVSLSRPQLLLVLGITSPSGGLAAVSADGIGATSSSSNATAAPAPWIDYIPRQVLRVLDISRFSLPSKEVVWSRLVQTFLTSRELPLSLGPSTFEYIRETYWERDADLDSVLDAVRLACFIHFSGKPESVFTIPGQAKRVRFYSWTPKMVERMKIAFLTTDEAGDLVLPLLTHSTRPSELNVNKFLEEVSRSDQFILGELDKLRHPRELLCFRLEFAVRFLFRAFEALMRIQSRASTAAQALHARNAAASMAAQQVAEMDEQRQLERASEILTQVVMQCLNASVGSLEVGRRPPAALTLRSGLARLCNAARRLLSDEFETLLDDMVAAAEDEVARIENAMAEDGEEAEEVEACPPGQLRSAGASITAQSAQFLAGLRTFQQRLSQTIVAGTAGIREDEDAEIAAAAATAAAGMESAQAAQQRREARLQRVQRKLLMEEKLLGLKREITDWIVHSVHDLVDWRHLSRSFSAADNGPLHLLRDIFWVDCYGPLSTLLDPSTRAGLTLPLSEPIEFVESLYDAALSVVPENELDDIELDSLKKLHEPDVCRLFQLYLECGKFVNLADWYDAFKQTVEVDRIADEAERDLRREASEQQEAEQGERVRDGEPETPSRRQGTRKRPVHDMAESDDDSDLPDTPSKGRRRAARQHDATATPESELQSRFALALNELARMGMIRGTRRRQEHITKVMWDLVPDSF
ncbi:hypothetical protein EX895_000849 [Sporisorium graminicola]|uniref:Uncharacterized protein n=1 Tax=Sporisorium graminicola TaxID=280036 RepID=A0A4U7L0U6_9BASI|nr:hypothetical protein EX895_000849 [Sporisorium graminicola]TKY90851.1 hypothetical protein EX895_000849 [Sporisorium graminicola]